MSEGKEHYGLFGNIISNPVKYDPFECMHNDEIIFEYRLMPAEIDYEDYDYNFSVTIYRKGYLIYRKYDMDDIEVKFKKYNLKKNTLRKIYDNIIESDIKDIPEDLDNGSCDGSFNIFLFFDDKRISILNIVDEEYQPERLDKNYAKKFGQNYYYECKVMKLFNLIAQELSKEGYCLDLDSFKKKFLINRMRF